VPIRRFHSAADLPAVPARAPGDPDNLRMALRLAEVCYRLHPWRFPPGVHKHGCLAELLQARERWDVANGAPWPRARS
jgi:hypothetical protein